MADMQLIVPPLDGNKSQEQDNAAAAAASSGGMNPDAESHDSSEGQGSVLPDGLRANFEEMKSVWRDARRATNGEEREELKRKERVLAAETAVAAHAEIAMWQNGIAELEALLREQEQDGGGAEDEEEADELGGEQPQQDNVVVEFPALLSIVVPEEGEMDAEHDDGSL